MFRKLPLLEILKVPLLTGVAGLHYIIWNATKNELPTNFLKGALKLTENFKELISHGVPYQKFTDLQTAVSALPVLFYKKLRKAKIKTLKRKIKCLQCLCLCRRQYQC